MTGHERGEQGLFEAYAGFYDALYADKDYEAECDFLTRVFSANGVDAGASVLDLGCGTGGHLIPLASRGFAMSGVDRSESMVAKARIKAAEHGVPAEFFVADVRRVELGRRFDAVISMFAVVSYQLENRDIASMFSASRSHLEKGGLFVFDVWFGPAVLVEQPEARIKTVQMAGGDTITRAAHPSLDILGQTVTVAYEITRESGGRVIEQTSESHQMRFLFAQEIRYFLEEAGFQLTALGPFMDLGRRLTVSDWNISVVATAI